jgi:hypothetical protein
MSKLLAVSLLLLTLVACASGNTTAEDNSRVDVEIAQISDVPPAARFEQGPISLQFALRATNNDAAPVTLKRVTIASQSEGAYHVGPYSTPFNVTIATGERQEVTFFAPGQTGQSLVGANGPVTLRVTTEFDSPTGKFQQVMTRVVNPNASVLE